jgi:hypothetical protein
MSPLSPRAPSLHARRGTTPRPAAAVPYRPASSRQVRPRTTSTLRPVGRRTTSSSRWSSTRSVDGRQRPDTSSSTGAERSRLRPAGGHGRLHASGGPSDYPSLSGAATRGQCQATLRATSNATRPAPVNVDRQSFRTLRLSTVRPLDLLPARHTQTLHVNRTVQAPSRT